MSGPARPDREVTTPDLAEVETVVRDAIDRRNTDALSTVGSGEFTLALRWGRDSAECVVKRVPPFSSHAVAEQYVAVVDDYIDRLQRAGTRCVATAQHILDRPDGTAVVYETQPLLDASWLADHHLRATAPSPYDPVVAAIVDRIVAVVGHGTPIDGQVANWYWFEDEPWQLDVSTPFFVDDTGHLPYEVAAFLSQFPKPLRGYVHKEFRRLAPKFRDVDYVVTDVMTQLHRQQLQHWCDTVATYARAAHGLDVSPAQAAQLAADEAKFYPMLHRAKRAQRWWIQHTRRRFDTLLPTSSSYG